MSQLTRLVSDVFFKNDCIFLHQDTIATFLADLNGSLKQSIVSVSVTHIWVSGAQVKGRGSCKWVHIDGGGVHSAFSKNIFLGH